MTLNRIKNLAVKNSAAKYGACLMAAASLFALQAAPAAAQGPITFQDVFANPDDKQLNIDYARQEAAAGNLLASAATLERLLIDDPNWDEARLFYAAVLYRLGDFSGAEREVRILEARPLSPDLGRQLNDFKDRLRDKQSNSSFSGSLSFGVTYDDNVAVNTGNDELLADVQNDDLGITFRARGKYTYDIGGVQDLKFVALASTYSKLYEEFGRVDFNFLAARTGFEGANGPFDWRVLLDYKNLDIAGDQYLKDFGFSARVRREVTPKTSIQFDGDYSYQSYDNIIIGEQPTLIEDQRSGIKYTGIVSVNHKVTAQIRASAGFGLQTKKAEFEPYAYSTTLATAAVSRSFKNGSYAVANYFYRQVDYREPDIAIVGPTTDTREEDRHYVRGAVGVPIGAFIEVENPNLQDTLDSLRVEVSAFHDERQANFDVYDFENTGAEVQLIWNFK